MTSLSSFLFISLMAVKEHKGIMEVVDIAIGHSNPLGDSRVSADGDLTASSFIR